MCKKNIYNDIILMNNIILEARQKSSSKVNAHGDFETVLVEPIKIEAGDEILLHSAFIDTTEVSSEKVVLDDDVDVEIQNLLYNFNWDDTDKTYELDTTTTPAVQKVDGLHYTL